MIIPPVQNFLLLGSTVVGAFSSFLWAVGVRSPWLGCLLGLGVGLVGEFLVLGWLGHRPHGGGRPPRGPRSMSGHF